MKGIRLSLIILMFLLLIASISAWDCEVTQGTNYTLYYANNNQLMWNEFGGGFVEKHILCYNYEWYEVGPTWDWNPWNGDFIPFENVVAPGTKIGDWTAQGSNGIWVNPCQNDTNQNDTDDYGNNLSCYQLDFNCDGKVDINDKAVINDVFSSRVAYNGSINSQVVNHFVEKYNYCGNLENYLNGLLTRNTSSKGKFTFNDLTRLINKFDSCQDNDNDQNETDDDNDNNRKESLRLLLSGNGDFCTENWQCSDWSSCEDGIQTRSCIDLSSCEFVFSKPIELTSCSDSYSIEPITLKQVIKESNFSWIFWIGVGIIILLILIIIVYLLK